MELGRLGGEGEYDQNKLYKIQNINFLKQEKIPTWGRSLGAWTLPRGKQWTLQDMGSGNYFLAGSP